MHSSLRRALLAAALGLGVTAGLARAEEKELGRPAPAVVPPAEAVPQEVALEAAPEATPAPGRHCGARHPVLALLRPRTYVEAVRSHLPLGCYGHHNDYSCGSIHSELTFLFGSCRQFYGERCLKSPPLSPVAGYDPATQTFTPPGAPGPVYAPSLDPQWYAPQRSGCGCH
ncbi:MAG: hypothetical protein HYS12_24225 [Planctomycetes bacterium]|nr:hypothetical protein [Planctomycetota bacterium]